MVRCLLCLTAAGLTATQAAAAQRTRDVYFYFEQYAAGDSVRDYPAMLRAAESAWSLAPVHPAILFSLARAQVLAGQPDRAMATLARLAALGDGREIESDTLLNRLAARPGYGDLLARMAANRRPVISGTPVFVTPDTNFLPEGLTYDPQDESFYVGSLAKHSLSRRTRDGSWTQIVGPEDGLLRVVGVKLDGPRRRLWFATWEPGFDTARSAGRRVVHTRLFEYDLDARRLVRSVAPPDTTTDHLLNDLAITPAGDLFVTDTYQGTVYRLRRGQTRLELLARPDPHFSDANGIALSDDGRRLYVAFLQGIAVVDQTTGRVTLLPGPPSVSSAGIDGLYYSRGSLVAVQTVRTLERVVRFDLDGGGRRIVGARVLEARHPLMHRPTTGALVGDTLYYIPDSQYDRLGVDGSVRPGPVMRPSSVLRLPVWP